MKTLADADSKEWSQAELILLPEPRTNYGHKMAVTSRKMQTGEKFYNKVVWDERRDAFSFVCLN